MSKKHEVFNLAFIKIFHLLKDKTHKHFFGRIDLSSEFYELMIYILSEKDGFTHFVDFKDIPHEEVLMWLSAKPTTKLLGWSQDFQTSNSLILDTPETFFDPSDLLHYNYRWISETESGFVENISLKPFVKELPKTLLQKLLSLFEERAQNLPEGDFELSLLGYLKPHAAD